MKKIIYSLLFLFACGCSFTSCSDDDNDVIKHDTTPETAIVGTTYVGTWSKDQIGGSTTTGEGTLSFSAAQDEKGNAMKYATVVSAQSSSLKLSKESVANVTWANNDLLFSQQYSTTGFGTKFSGKITEDGIATISFTVTEKSGRKNYNYIYTFTGTKQ